MELKNNVLMPFLKIHGLKLINNKKKKSKNKNKLEILEILLEPNKFPNLPVPEFKINLLNKKLLLNNLSNT